MRGQNLLRDITVNPIIDTESKHYGKGRNAALIEARNRMLFCRYYWLVNFTIFRYENIINFLANEFFLAPRRVLDILAKDNGLLFELRKSKPKKAYFIQQWPNICWDYKKLVIR